MENKPNEFSDKGLLWAKIYNKVRGCHVLVNGRIIFTYSHRAGAKINNIKSTATY